jgi:2,4-dienoyl-CoA reductase-like NADH-dependent reductase (Old Yellow Enzyme family)
MKLFTPLKVRDIELKNRIVASLMCEYSAKDGHPQP